ncbi:NAD(P)-binding protein, partial [Patellaria atrata CBS 101060]
IQNVVLIGSAGEVGRNILPSLLSAGFTVTLLTRPTSTLPNEPPYSNLPILRAAYNDNEGLQAAFTNQDAVVCSISATGNNDQILMLEVAAAVGIKRFVLSEFANRPDFVGLEDFQGPREMKTRIAKRAQELQDEKGMEWAGLVVGNFFDWSIKRFPVFGFSLPTQKAIIYDGGDTPITGVTMAHTGQAIAGILKLPLGKTNKHFLVRSVETTQSEILTAFEAVTGQKWMVENVNTRDLLEQGRAKKERGEKSYNLDLVVAQIFG